MANFKYYVVWEGHAPGIYETWEDCKQQISGYPGAKYKSFTNKEAATKAFRDNYDDHIGALQTVARALRGESKVPVKTQQHNTGINPPVNNASLPYNPESIAVDAACSGNPGPMEYRGVYVRTGEEIFRIGPFEDGTNNIGEFLALVHGLALLKAKGSSLPIYTDSVTGQSWVRHKQCKSKLERTPRNEKIFELVERAEAWLRANTWTTPVYKWNTKEWGEIPADFGRK
ncbi:MAG: viroplasmin family protein [Bacteroidales bacterium]